MKYMTRDEAMVYLRVSNTQFWRLTREQKIPYYQDRPGSRMMFSEADLDEYMASIRNTAPVMKALPGGTYRKQRVRTA